MNHAKPVATSDLYTAILALTLLVVVFTVGFVVFKCSADYGTIFQIRG